jgi:hypothetical protein
MLINILKRTGVVQYIDIKYSTDDMSHITYSNSELKYKHTYVADRGLAELIKIFKTKVWAAQLTSSATIMVLRGQGIISSRCLSLFLPTHILNHTLSIVDCTKINITKSEPVYFRTGYGGKIDYWN